MVLAITAVFCEPDSHSQESGSSESHEHGAHAHGDHAHGENHGVHVPVGGAPISAPEAPHQGP